MTRIVIEINVAPIETGRSVLQSAASVWAMTIPINRRDVVGPSVRSREAL
jgi:hypothetical protein